MNVLLLLFIGNCFFVLLIFEELYRALCTQFPINLIIFCFVIIVRIEKPVVLTMFPGFLIGAGIDLMGEIKLSLSEDFFWWGLIKNRAINLS